MILDPDLTLLTKINLNGSDLNVRSDTVKVLGENIGEKILDTGLGNYFLNKIPKAQAKKI